MEHSLTIRKGLLWELRTCLNPYSNGTLSDLRKFEDSEGNTRVLILILMEHSLTHYQRALYNF